MTTAEVIAQLRTVQIEATEVEGGKYQIKDTKINFTFPCTVPESHLIKIYEDYARGLILPVREPMKAPRSQKVSAGGA